MNKFLMILAVALAGGCFLLGAKWNDTANDLASAQTDLMENEEELAGLRSAVEAAAKSDRAVIDRLDDLNQDILRSRNAPVTATCGPVVHDAIDRMRDRAD